MVNLTNRENGKATDKPQLGLDLPFHFPLFPLPFPDYFNFGDRLRALNG
jgi:hypothetical protein